VASAQFYDLLNRIRCSDHHCQGILKLAQKNSLFLKSSISKDHCTVNSSISQSHSKKIPFVLLLLLPSFARTVRIQVATQFFMICRTAACILTAVLTLYFKVLPDSSDLLPEDSQLGAGRRKQCRGTWCYSPRPLWCSISSCSQDCAIHATSSFSPAASTHIVIVARFVWVSIGQPIHTNPFFRFLSRCIGVLGLICVEMYARCIAGC
jgi:hypothetical protein